MVGTGSLLLTAVSPLFRPLLVGEVVSEVIEALKVHVPLGACV